MTHASASSRPLPLKHLLARLFCAGALFAGALLVPAASQASDPLPKDEKALEAFIRDYLMKNPEVIIDAIEAFQRQQEVAQEEETRNQIRQLAPLLSQHEDDPILGNAEGDVTLVEFFDYACGYCKKVAPALRSEMERDGKVRMVMKEWPILSEASLFAARAALAAKEQGLYEELHWALMELRAPLSEEVVIRMANQVGADLVRLRNDMTSPKVDAQLARNRQLARALNLRGTPAFVIGDELYPGALELDDLRGLIKGERERAG